MIVWSYGTVMRIIREEETLQEVEVRVGEKDLSAALNYPQLTGRIEPGEKVIMNTTAVELGLGSGGKHFVSARIGADGQPIIDAEAAQCGHIIKLRYTPFQHAVQTAEEGKIIAESLDMAEKALKQTPVIIGETHSMLPAFVLSIRYLSQREGEGKIPRICYIMSEGGALPLALSDHIRHLQSLGLLVGTITYGHTFGGQTECVNLYTALLAARFVWEADMIVIMPGPGIVGTGTALGFSGMEQVAIIETVHKLGGIPILIPRVSRADSRERHAGISHHTATVLRFVRNTPLLLNLEQNPELIAQIGEQSRHHTLILHDPLNREEWQAIEASYPGSLTTMGRTAEEDPAFFVHTYYAARLAQSQYEKREAVRKMDLFA